MTWVIRPGGPADTAACHAVYFDAVRNGTAPHYTAEQAAAWAPSATPDPWLESRLAAGETWIACTNERAEGFLTVTPTGHLDFFFIRPEWRGSGMAAALHDRMADWVADRRLRAQTTYASHLCRRFLERRGWQMLERETAERNGGLLTRWKMGRTA